VRGSRLTSTARGKPAAAGAARARRAALVSTFVSTALILTACGPRRVVPSSPVVQVAVQNGRFTEVDRGLRSGDRIELGPGPHVLAVAFDLRGAEIAPGVGDDWQATVRCRIELQVRLGQRYSIRIRRREGTGLNGPEDALYGAEIVDDRGWRAPGIARCEWSAKPHT